MRFCHLGYVFFFFVFNITYSYDLNNLVYTLYIDTVDGKQTPSTSLTDLSIETINVALDAGNTYYWRVKTSDGKNSSYSVVRSFKTK
jgi:hypothetical protein